MTPVRPLHVLERTARTSEGIFHYTCNPPSEVALRKCGIRAIGDEFGADAREVLIIPEPLYRRFGYEIGNVKPETLGIISEQLLRRL